MKFRQTLTAAAAAAVLAPGAVLATPAAAFATAAEAPDRPADTDASQQTGNPEDGGKPGQPGGATESGGASGTGEPATGTDGNQKPGTGNGTGPATGSGSGTETGSGKDTTSRPGKGTGTQPGQDPKTEPGTTTGGSKSEDDEPSGGCDVEAGRLRMSIEGWRPDFVAGADWSHFSLKIANTTGKAMERIRLEPLAYSFEIVDYPPGNCRGRSRTPVRAGG
ncbi:hypothetical protein [Streptomyces chrestomyceticus]|uniref:hypothetical protein n=1 Tax=Streptomyces chrestomyceticus TaxID=68185 RepID=UPI0033EC9EE4